MDGEQKLQRQLTASEEDLRSRLRELLPAIANEGSPLFTNSEFNPHSLNAAHMHAQSEDLLRAANSCVAMRAQLGLPIAGSVGALFIAACREGADLNNAHRRGPRRLASWLLEELG